MNRYTRWKNMYAVPAKWQINLTCSWQKPYKDKSHIVPKNSHKDIGFALSNKQLTLHKLATRKLRVYTSWWKATNAPVIYTLCSMQYCVVSIIASGSYQQLLVFTSSYQQLVVVISSYWQLLVVVGSYQQLLVVNSSSWYLLVVSGIYQQLLVVTSIQWQLLVVTSS